ncbi:hypothetical protein TEA_005663 [Camellia sinensis var. sinensis]|uniref:Reverse transcriptase zinc-binding domain-containing protein n=1 Tax=Camellia sinensis var. sinensis TaxID=542762 RepID=A0A4S4E3W4_CAMSN|nr:hypothetical protein TEA_005663 [Camellia sinensis var. sinensis]
MPSLYKLTFTSIVVYKAYKALTLTLTSASLLELSWISRPIQALLDTPRLFHIPESSRALRTLLPRSRVFQHTLVRPTNTNTNTKANPSRNCTFKALKASSSSSNAESSLPKPKPNSSYSPEKSSQAEPSKTHDPVKLAFAKATAYKKSNPTPNVIIVQNQNPLSLSESDETGITNELACNEMEKENEKNNEIIAGSSSGIADKSEALFSECAKLDTKNDGSPSEVTIGGNQEVPASVKLGMEKAKEYLKNKGVMGSSKSVEESQTNSGLKGGNALFDKMVATKEERKISSIDFMGLDFGEKKKSRGLPAGLVPVADSFPERDLRDVEILVGDTSNFGNATVSKPSSTEEDQSDIYKPKISTWGVFPRPSNISKTFCFTTCPTCVDAVEFVEHLLFHCRWAKAVWFGSDLCYKTSEVSIMSALKWTLVIMEHCSNAAYHLSRVGKVVVSLNRRNFAPTKDHLASTEGLPRPPKLVWDSRSSPRAVEGQSTPTQAN